ncbi:type II secretion system GspH family protein [Patescibacteria group bacterium]|nr:type II secretion system GspH family protein [Patescibacteria group bacterium]
MKKQLGFTLVELLVVVGILSVISVGAISILNPSEQFKKASDARKKADLSQIQKALESFYEDNGSYPEINGSGDFRIKALNGNVVDWGTSWQPYMNILPKSPSGTYVYYSSGGQSYYLYASLERTGDPQLCNNGDACTGLTGVGGEPDLTVACGGVCTYGVSSPNVSP